MIAAFLQLPGLPQSTEERVLSLCAAVVKMYLDQVHFITVSS